MINLDEWQKKIEDMDKKIQSMSKEEIINKIKSNLTMAKIILMSKYPLYYYYVGGKKITIDWEMKDCFAYTDGNIFALTPHFALLSVEDCAFVLAHEASHDFQKHIERLPLLKSINPNLYVINIVADAIMNLQLDKFQTDIREYALSVCIQEFNLTEEMIKKLSLEELVVLVKSNNQEQEQFNVGNFTEKTGKSGNNANANDNNNDTIQEGNGLSTEENIKKAQEMTQKTEHDRNFEPEKPENKAIKIIRRFINEIDDEFLLTYSKINKFNENARGKVFVEALPKLFIFSDISGSMTGYLNHIYSEIFTLIKNHNIKMKIVMVDEEIRKILDVNSKKDLNITFPKGRGTFFSPSLEKVKKMLKDNDILIMITDFQIEDYNQSLKIWKTIKTRKVAFNQNFEVNKEWN